jgi:5-methylcytosine-specific restriction protein A
MPIQNPNWTRDELILAVEFYKIYAPSIPGKTDSRLIKLAEEIKSLAKALGLQGDEAFRNPNGVYMKLMEFRKYDPAYTGKGLGRKLRDIEQEVWDLSPDAVSSTCKLIRSTLTQLEENDFAGGIGADISEPEIEEALEGALVTRLHRRRERSQKIVTAKKKQFLSNHDSLFCEACGFDFAKVYGDRGNGFIECHHTLPVSEMTPGEKTKLSELALVCANCHRMIHSKRPWLRIQDIKDLLKN